MNPSSDLSAVISLTQNLIAFRSTSGNEGPVLDFLSIQLAQLGLSVKHLSVPDTNLSNLFVSVGTPQVLLTTHVDVVPGPENLFSPSCDGEFVHGRGACDAKGIVACMVQTVKILHDEGKRNFGLLLVVGEEVDGAGAKAATKALEGKGIEHLINGEPTECKLTSSQKGLLTGRVSFAGRSCHSGYPHLGDDANRKMITAANKLIETEFGFNPKLGHASLNIGLLSGGTAQNVVSDHAEFRFSLRTVSDGNENARSLIVAACRAGEVEFFSNRIPLHFETLPGFETTPVAYGSDAPYYLPLGAKLYQFGPGSIDHAHTDEERILISELEKGLEGYLKIMRSLISD